jgi:hypothetical protein
MSHPRKGQSLQRRAPSPERRRSDKAIAASGEPAEVLDMQRSGAERWATTQQHDGSERTPSRTSSWRKGDGVGAAAWPAAGVEWM